VKIVDHRAEQRDLLLDSRQVLVPPLVLNESVAQRPHQELG
jgi:hypothetical protein